MLLFLCYLLPWMLAKIDDATKFELTPEMQAELKELMKKVREFVGNNTGTYKEAELKLLDGVADLRTRCLIAVLFGNDTFPKELKHLTIFKDMGPAAVRGMMERLGEDDGAVFPF